MKIHCKPLYFQPVCIVNRTNNKVDKGCSSVTTCQIGCDENHPESCIECHAPECAGKYHNTHIHNIHF